ncbi:MAG: UDP-N-acetylmuramate dehydrogenase [Pseudomonadota bacterium]
MKQFTIDNIDYDMSSIRGLIKTEEALSEHTTWKVGGRAKIYFQPDDVNDLQQFLKKLENEQHQILWLGLGSNVLIRDKGFNGIVINTVGRLKQINFFESDKKHKTSDKYGKLMVSAESGVSCAKFSREVAAAGFTGAEFFSGIPGSMGGAIAMNAGAFGGECWRNLEYVETIDESGNIKTRNKNEFNISYRQVKGLQTTDKGNSEWYIKGFFSYPQSYIQGSDLENIKIAESKAKIKALLAERNLKQPVQYANAGSVFRNPEGDYAARLIERCGLKNQQIGNAVVSEKHANFIINKGGAKASDIEALIEMIQQQVYNKFSITLQPEVHIYGER